MMVGRGTRVLWTLLAGVLLVAASQGQTMPGGAATRPGGGAAAGLGPSVLEGLPIVRGGGGWGTVEVEGNKRTPTQLIMDQIRSQPGQAYSRALAEVDQVSVSALERFAWVRVDVVPQENPATHALTGVVLRFVVEELPQVTAVEIAGNRKFKDVEIREGLITRVGTAVDQWKIDMDRRYLIDMYKKKGYAQVSVEVDQELLARQGVVRLQIIEGPETHITKIVYEGNTALKASYINWRIQTKTYFWIFRKGILEEDKLQADLVTIRDLYLKKGYLDVRVSYVLDYSEDKRNLTLRFVIIEGMRYRVGKITVEGNTVFSTAELLANTAKFGPGSFAERDKLEALQKRIEDQYGHEGYIDRMVDINPSFTAEPGVVDIKVHILEGKPYIVGRIIIRGNQNIQDRVIRRQLRIYPDQTFDIVQVRKSIERLKATRIFQDVKVTPIGSDEKVRDALVEVAEGQTGKFSIGAGVSTNSGLVGQLSVEQQNFDITNWPHSLDEFLRGQSFKGAGQYFRILLEPGTEFQRYRLTFSEPYLLDSPYSFTNDLYYFTRARESWDERRVGDIVTFGRRYGDVWSVTAALRAEQVDISHPVDLFDDGITQVAYPVSGPNGGIARYNDTAQEILDEKGSHFLTSIKPQVVRDTTDSLVFPTTGTRTSLSLEQYGIFGGDVDITKIVFDFTWYTTLYTDLFDRKTVLALRNEVGLIPFGTSPTYERFYLGGIGELRGFKYRGVGPRSGPLNDPIGGDFEWMTTVEVNFPIYEEMLRGVVFVDVGTVESDITITSIRSDIGAGVRLNLPLFGGVPIALDFAYPVTKKSYDETQFVSVSLGLPF
jgi:outer membrane protein insertion porin family